MTVPFRHRPIGLADYLARLTERATNGDEQAAAELARFERIEAARPDPEETQ